MLTHLSINNIVLIDRCDLAFAPGLCVLTGETGAGKSILLDALGLVLGTRADLGLIRSAETQASVIAAFDVTNAPAAKEAAQQLGIECEEETLVLRRTLAADGKARCFINDQPVTASALRQVGECLVEIHGQHDQRGLLDAAQHRIFLDAYGRLEPQQRETATLFARFSEAKQALESARARLQQALGEQEYLRFVRDELRALAPQAGEELALAERRSLMMQSEKLGELLGEVTEELTGAKAVESSLNAAVRMLSRSALNTAGRFDAVTEALGRAAVEVEEAMKALETIASASAHDPAVLEQSETRLFALRAAARKHAVTVDELPAFLASVEHKISLLESGEDNIHALEREVAKAREDFIKEAKALSAERQRAAKKLETAVMKELKPLKMESTRFRIAVEELPEPQWSAQGVDAVRFEAATNVGSGFAPLVKIASGGELSRFMLALKVALAGVQFIPTLIFDEIDSGTSGAIADAIGQRLALLGKKAQVLVVTHLPQVAARGAYHLKVMKEEKKQATFTRVAVLDENARREELARMLAGAEVTKEARHAAGKLLEAAG